MSADYITSKKVNNKREKLSEVLPLKVPFNVQIFVSNVCNFKCCYCAQSSDEKTQNELGLIKKYMTIDIFRKCVDNIVKLGKLKQFVITGMGEPLLNPNIIEMISYAKEKDVADRIELVTNASMLNNNMVDKIIDTNIDRVRISLQGLSKEDYKRVSNIDINYDEFTKRIKYFYENKKDTKIYIKVIEEMLSCEEDKKIFIESYKNMCDEISIESLTPPPMECELKQQEFLKSRAGGIIKSTKVCALPFYSFIINYDGSIYPCCVLPLPRKIGDATKDLGLIWNKDKHKELLLTLLNGKRDDIPECGKCDGGKYVMSENDYLDDALIELKNKYMDI